MKDKEKYSKLKSFHFVCEKNYLLFSQILPNLNEEKVFSFGLPIKNSKLSEVSINLKKVSKFTSEIKVCLAAELSKLFFSLFHLIFDPLLKATLPI